GQLEQRAVAARDNIRNDVADHLLDVLCGLAFERKQTPKSVREIRALTVQTKGHDLILPGRPGRQGQWLMRVLASTLGVTYMLNQARFDFGVPSLTSAWAGQRPVVQVDPRSANSASRHSTSSRTVAPPENSSRMTPDGASVSLNSTARRLRTSSLCAGSTCRHLQLKTRSNRRAARRRRNSGLSPCAPSQSNRLRATTTRLSSGRHRMSETLTTASCRWVEATSRSSSSRTTNFSASMASHSLPRVIRQARPTMQDGQRSGKAGSRPAAVQRGRVVALVSLRSRAMPPSGDAARVWMAAV